MNRIYRICTGDRHLRVTSAFQQNILMFHFMRTYTYKMDIFLVNIKVKILNIIENVQIIQYSYFKAYFRTFKQKGRSQGYSVIKKPGPDIWHAV